MRKQPCKYALSLFILVTLTVIGVPWSSRADDKPKVEEIIAKHLESIGAAETIASVTSRIIAGSVTANMRAPKQAKMSGSALLASEGAHNTIGMGFENPGKYEERFAFDGNNVSVGYARPGVRGVWGDFLLTHDNIIKLGLVGGTLSTSWPLVNMVEKKQKLEFNGTKKIGDHTLYAIKYVPRGSSDLEIQLFFDTQTYQHIRTEYTRVISAGLGSGQIPSGRPASAAQSGAVDGSGQQRTTRYKMTEEFSDFRKESGLMMPHAYKITLELDTRGGTQLIDWEINLTDFLFNQKIPPTTFVVAK